MSDDFKKTFLLKKILTPKKNLLSERRRVFVSYHHKSDQVYYIEFCRIFNSLYETIQNNSLDRIIESDNTEYVMRNIRENFITGTSSTIVLCGPYTRWRKYVDWEIKATLDKRHGIIGVKLPNNIPDSNGRVHIPDRLLDNINTGYAIWCTWEDLMQGPDFLHIIIERANTINRSKIDNSRALRKRNE